MTPRNVLLSRDGQVKLSDYGLALSGGTDGAILGTPHYMAPEQASGAMLDGRADLFALGKILEQIGDDRFASIVARATAADPGARFASADALRAELEVIATGSDERALASLVAARPVRSSSADSATARTLSPTTARDPSFARLLRATVTRVLVPERRVRMVAFAVAFAFTVVAGHTMWSDADPAPTVLDVPVCFEGEGMYCGEQLRQYGVVGTDPNALYLCTAGHATVRERCDDGCVINPPGYPDVCGWP